MQSGCAGELRGARRLRPRGARRPRSPRGFLRPFEVTARGGYPQHSHARTHAGQVFVSIRLWGPKCGHRSFGVVLGCVLRKCDSCEYRSVCNDATAMVSYGLTSDYQFYA
ncbi:hypothetical protein VPH35_105595 [Triticum aestivum]|uniref:Uncharacterized protein n=1 Tax=Triticum urartu TaxID=4572 RepID=A0A8R7QVC2_TRIUA